MVTSLYAGGRPDEHDDLADAVDSNDDPSETTTAIANSQLRSTETMELAGDASHQDLAH